MKKIFNSIATFVSVVKAVLMPYNKGGNKQILVFLLFLLSDIRL